MALAVNFGYRRDRGRTAALMFITAAFGWRASFLAILVVSAIATPAGWWMLRRSPVKPGQRFDLAGAALFLLATGSLMLALNATALR